MNRIAFIFISFLFLLTACTDTDPTAEQTQEPDIATLLLGRWELNKAMRNGKITRSLDGAFFEFRHTGVMRSNFYGSEQEANYTLEDRVIHQAGKNPTDFRIELLDDKKLVLFLVAQGIKFRLALDKSEPQS